MGNIIEQVAKFLWECDQEGTTDEWREMAWNDMGGSEPTDERQTYEIRAQALADAGLLARTLPTREEIADELSGWPIGTGYYQTRVATDEAQDMADAVLALLKGQDT